LSADGVVFLQKWSHGSQDGGDEETDETLDLAVSEQQMLDGWERFDETIRKLEQKAKTTYGKKIETIPIGKGDRV